MTADDVDMTSRTITLRQSGGLWHARFDGGSAVGRGATADAACDDLRVQELERIHRAKAAGFDAVGGFPTPSGVTARRPLLVFAGRAAVIAVIVLLTAQPLAWTLTPIVERGVRAGVDGVLYPGGGKLPQRLERAALELARPEQDLPPERKAALINALQALNLRYRPYLDAMSASGATKALQAGQVSDR